MTKEIQENDASLDKDLSSVSEEQETLEGADEGTVQVEETAGEVSEPETVKLGGTEYPIDQVQEALQKARDYDYLLPEYTRVTQRLSALEKAREGTSNPPTAEENELKKAAELLAPYIQQQISEKYISRDEYNQKLEEQRLEDSFQLLEDKYDGSNGLPKFDRRAVLTYCVQHGITDLEAGYKLMNEPAIQDYYLRQGKVAPKAPVSNAGEGTIREPAGKKRVFGFPENPDEEITLREAMEERLKNIGSEE